MVQSVFQQMTRGSSITNQSPPFDLLKDVGRKILEALQVPKCEVVGSVQGLTYKTGNSQIICTPQLVVADVLALHDRAKISVNFVFIQGEANEAPHIHHSHVIALVLSGTGELLHLPSGSDSKNKPSTVVAEAGDIVVIPKGVLHIFNCNRGQNLLYAALEIADRDIDYQKHYY